MVIYKAKLVPVVVQPIEVQRAANDDADGGATGSFLKSSSVAIKVPPFEQKPDNDDVYGGATGSLPSSSSVAIKIPPLTDDELFSRAIDEIREFPEVETIPTTSELQYAYKNNDVKLISSLLAKEMSDELEHACETNDVKTIGRLLDSGAQNIECTNNCAFTPICWAINSGQLEAVKMLHKRGANLTTVGREGENGNLLHCAVGLGHERSNAECVRWCLDNTAININSRDTNGNTALQLALLKEDDNASKILIQRAWKGGWFSILMWSKNLESPIFSRDFWKLLGLILLCQCA
jgi:ankyrin repeat protein